MVSRTMVIKGKNGLHLRPAGRISEAALRFRSEITLEYNEGLSTANARSVLSLLAAGLQEGDVVKLCCRGSDEKEALDAVARAFSEETEAVPSRER
ncbi:MAG: HPr family phosphocarrier protein [Bilifractor sp.]|jgi:phosphocarrier protein HPr